MEIYTYRLFCNTENLSVDTWVPRSNPAPTLCPNHPEHVLDPTKTAVVATSRTGPGVYLDNGSQVVAPTFEYDNDLTMTWKSQIHTAPPGVTSFFDYEITQEIFIRGGGYEIFSGGSVGDYFEFSVIDKIDALGLYAMFGLTVGVDILELHKFVRTDYFNPTNPLPQKFTSLGASQVRAGLTFRVAVTSTGTNPVVLKVLYNFHE